MRRLVAVIAIGLLTASVAVGCNSDASSGESNGDDTWTSDVDDDRDTGEEPDDTSTDRDTSVPIPDTSADTGGGGDTGATDGGGDTTATDGGTNDDGTTYADGGEVGTDGALPTSFGPGSFLRHFYIDDEQGQRSQTDGRCCYDFESGQFGNGTDNDNAVADLIADVGSAVGVDLDSVNASINQRIQGGQLIYLFEYGDWSMANWENDSSIEMNIFKGQDAQSPFQDNLNGNGSFFVTQGSYRSNGQPKWQFNSASTNSGTLEASGGNVVLQLQLLFGVTLRLRLKDPHLQATVESSNLDLQSGGTVALSDGKLAGKIPKADIYNGFNKAVATCGCLGGQDLFTDANDDDTYQCTQKQGTCNCPQRLEDIIDQCGAIRFAVGTYQDYDTNSTSGNDALSVGASFDAVGAEITGTTQ